MGEDLFQALQGNVLTSNLLWLHTNAVALSQHNSDMVLLVSLTVGAIPSTLIYFLRSSRQMGRRSYLIYVLPSSISLCFRSFLPLPTPFASLYR
jgi:hypothetical protein